MPNRTEILMPKITIPTAECPTCHQHASAVTNRALATAIADHDAWHARKEMVGDHRCPKCLCEFSYADHRVGRCTSCGWTL